MRLQLTINDVANYAPEPGRCGKGQHVWQSAWQRCAKPGSPARVARLRIKRRVSQPMLRQTKAQVSLYKDSEARTMRWPASNPIRRLFHLKSVRSRC